MKLLAIFDSFKECMTSLQAGRAAAAGLEHTLPGTSVIVLPGADGGEGTAEVMGECRGGEAVDCFAHDPFMRPVTARYYYCASDRSAYLDFASASGLSLLNAEERDPMLASSFGTGELIRHAIAHGAEKVTVCFGGSATNDGGAGMLQGLGGKFLREDGSEIYEAMCPALIRETDRVDFGALEALCRGVRFEGLYDSDVVFSGAQGASFQFSRQKGATGFMPGVLNGLLEELREKYSEWKGYWCHEAAGAGAAGGAGGALMWMCDAELRAGGEAVLDAVGFDSLLTPDTIVLTGEGKSDFQTLTGKFPLRVLMRGKKYGVPVVLFSGTVVDRELLCEVGFEDAISITPEYMSLSEALQRETAECNMMKNVAEYFRGHDASGN